MTLDSALRALEVTLRTSPPGVWIRHSVWGWPVLESLHFMGMSVLIGTIGLFDLRLLGFARGVPYAALHRLIPLGIGAYTLNLLTGTLLSLGHAGPVPVEPRLPLQGDVHGRGWAERAVLLQPRVPPAAARCRRTARRPSAHVWPEPCRWRCGSA